MMEGVTPSQICHYALKIVLHRTRFSFPCASALQSGLKGWISSDTTQNLFCKAAMLFHIQNYLWSSGESV